VSHDSLQRWYYELIKEWTPCQLYFDIAFSRLTNPDISDGTADCGLLQAALLTCFCKSFFTELSEEVTERYNPSRPLQYSDIIDWIRVRRPNFPATGLCTCPIKACLPMRLLLVGSSTT
jgi:hypothetical protein